MILCLNAECELKQKCQRFTDPPTDISEFRNYEPQIIYTKEALDGKDPSYECEYFIDNNLEN